MLVKRIGRAALIAACAALVSAPAFAESLEQALASAYTNNPQITSALLSVKSAAEGIVLAKSGTLPNLSASASVNSDWSVTDGTTSDSQSASIGLNYNQTLFDNLQTDADIEKARALTQAATESLRNTEQNVLLSAASAYVDVVTNTKLVQLRQETIKFLQAQVQSAQDRLNVGEGTRIELSQAQASLASAVASYKSAVADLQSSRATYARWIGHDPSGLSLSFNFRGLLPNSLTEARALAESGHPAILAAKASLRAAQADSDAADRAFGPTLRLVGSIGTSFSNARSANQNDFATTSSGSVGLSLSVPIYSGGALGAGARQANIAQIKSEVDALDTHDEVVAAVVASWSGLQNASAQITSAQAAIEANQLVLNGVIEERNVGQSTTLDVLNARSDLTSVQEGLISAQTGRMTAAFSLIAATGRLSARELGLPVQLKSPNGYVTRVEDVWQELRSISE